MIPELNILLKLVLAVIFGGLIGWEREIHERPAGFRTHILVCMGATLIMIISQNIHDYYGVAADPGRIAAQVVSGIGFLGAGTIIREGATVKGLTTAASLWAVAGVGLAVGAGLYFGAFFASIIIFASLWLLSQIEFMATAKGKYKEIRIRAIDQPGIMGQIGSILGEAGLNIERINLEPITHKPEIIINIKIRMLKTADLNQVSSQISSRKGIFEVEWL